MTTDDYVRLIRTLHTALVQMTDIYTELANSGEFGFWNPEEEAEVIFARQALAVSQDFMTCK